MKSRPRDAAPALTPDRAAALDRLAAILRLVDGAAAPAPGPAFAPADLDELAEALETPGWVNPQGFCKAGVIRAATLARVLAAAGTLAGPR